MQGREKKRAEKKRAERGWKEGGKRVEEGGHGKYGECSDKVVEWVVGYVYVGKHGKHILPRYSGQNIEHNIGYCESLCEHYIGYCESLCEALHRVL